MPSKKDFVGVGKAFMVLGIVKSVFEYRLCTFVYKRAMGLVRIPRGSVCIPNPLSNETSYKASCGRKDRVRVDASTKSLNSRRPPHDARLYGPLTRMHPT